MQDTQKLFVGVDVAKATLAIFIHGSNARKDLANTPVAIGAWLEMLPENASIAVESTGRYHQQLVMLAQASGRQAFVLNARDVYFYAKGLGKRGKSDRSDAQVIARYLAEHHDELKPWVAPTGEQSLLQELLRCRAGIATKRSSVRQVLHGVDELKKDIDALEEKFDALLASIDTKIAGLLKADERLKRRAQLLRTIPGVGPQGSAMLAALFSRLPFANVESVVAYSGLDPRPNDSGEKSGRRRISKRGSPELRRQLYLSAFSAGRSRQLRELYHSIKARGFKPTQALVILARKLLRIAWAIWNTEKPFDADLLGKKAACAKT
jgi:transposase